MWKLGIHGDEKHMKDKNVWNKGVRIFDDCKYGALDVKYTRTFIYNVIRI